MHAHVAYVPPLTVQAGGASASATEAALPAVPDAARPTRAEFSCLSWRGGAARLALRWGLLRLLRSLWRLALLYVPVVEEPEVGHEEPQREPDQPALHARLHKRPQHLRHVLGAHNGQREEHRAGGREERHAEAAPFRGPDEARIQRAAGVLLAVAVDFEDGEVVEHYLQQHHGQRHEDEDREVRHALEGGAACPLSFAEQHRGRQHRQGAGHHEGEDALLLRPGVRRVGAEHAQERVPVGDEEAVVPAELAGPAVARREVPLQGARQLAALAARAAALGDLGLLVVRLCARGGHPLAEGCTSAGGSP
mmetsp:Transcript_67182/g.216726  ORF Transcript_67182/g.216726 Transcript_67182/m.216726 type:complete len:308 (+) Transcript_67182:33-956(+)